MFRARSTSLSRRCPPRARPARPWLAALSLVVGCGTGGAGPNDGAAGGAHGGGAAGFALSFDGVNDYATAGDAAFPAAGAAQTIGLWVNYSSAATTQDFLVLRQDFDNGVQVGLRGGTVAVWTTYAQTTLVAAPAPPAASRWHHVAYTFDGTTHQLYVDGALVDSSTATPDKRTPTSVWLGTVDGSSELLAGILDEVRVWSLVRSATDIVADMAHRPAGAEPGLVAYWTFDDIVNGGRSDDASGLGNAVTLGDGVTALMPARVASDAPVTP